MPYRETGVLELSLEMMPTFEQSRQIKMQNWPLAEANLKNDKCTVGKNGLEKCNKKKVNISLLSQ